VELEGERGAGCGKGEAGRIVVEPPLPLLLFTELFEFEFETDVDFSIFHY